jgi:hypothetical protein
MTISSLDPICDTEKTRNMAEKWIYFGFENIEAGLRDSIQNGGGPFGGTSRPGSLAAQSNSWTRAKSFSKFVLK